MKNFLFILGLLISFMLFAPEEGTKSMDEVMSATKEAVMKGNRKIRKNAILALEIVTSFSRENRNQVPLEQWKEANVRWIQESFNADMEKYGEIPSRHAFERSKSTS